MQILTVGDASTDAPRFLSPHESPGMVAFDRCLGSARGLHPDSVSSFWLVAIMIYLTRGCMSVVHASSPAWHCILCA